MKQIKVRALRPLKRGARPIHPGEHFPVTVEEAAALVAAGDAAYRKGDAPKPKPAPKAKAAK
jgi:hypothetical protein